MKDLRRKISSFGIVLDLKNSGLYEKCASKQTNKNCPALRNWVNQPLCVTSSQHVNEGLADWLLSIGYSRW